MIFSLSFSVLKLTLLWAFGLLSWSFLLKKIRIIFFVIWLVCCLLNLWLYYQTVVHHFNITFFINFLFLGIFYDQWLVFHHLNQFFFPDTDFTLSQVRLIKRRGSWLLRFFCWAIRTKIIQYRFMLLYKCNFLYISFVALDVFNFLH